MSADTSYKTVTTIKRRNRSDPCPRVATEIRFYEHPDPLTADERKILADGCLINFYKH